MVSSRPNSATLDSGPVRTIDRQPRLAKLLRRTIPRSKILLLQQIWHRTHWIYHEGCVDALRHSHLRQTRHIACPQVARDQEGGLKVRRLVLELTIGRVGTVADLSRVETMWWTLLEVFVVPLYLRLRLLRWRRMELFVVMFLVL